MFVLLPSTSKLLFSRVLVRFNLAPTCSWVQERLCAYHDWDLPQAEMKAIERHTCHCPACAKGLASVHGLRQSLQPSFLRNPRGQLIAARIMVAIARETRPNSIASAARRRRVLCLSALSFALALSTAMAYIGSQAIERLQQKQTELPMHGKPTQVQRPPSRGLAQAEVPAKVSFLYPETVLLSTTRQNALLPSEIDGNIVAATVQAMLPHREEEYEAWARREYPHILWLYNVLRDKYSYDGTWQHLLWVSGDLFRFDYPLRLDDPNCRPSFESIKRASAAVGFVAEVGNSGGIMLPVLSWEGKRGMHIGFSSIKLTPAAKNLSTIAMPGSFSKPVGYEKAIAANPGVAQSVLVYILVSSQIISNQLGDTPLSRKSAAITREADYLLEQLMENYRTQLDCLRQPLQDHILSLLEQRRMLLAEIRQGIDTEDMIPAFNSAR